VIAAAAVASLSMLATACGGGSSAAGTGKDSSGKPVTITYWSWMPGTEETAKAFNKTHKDVQVTFSLIPAGGSGGYDKLAKGVKAGNAPDVVNVEYQAVPDLVTQGLLKDQSDLLGRTVKDNFPQSVQDLVTLGGKTWTTPYDVAPQIFYYRSDLFKKYGIEVPTTWAGFKTAAAKVKKADSKAHIAAFWGDDVATWGGLVQQAGGTWYGTSGDAWKVDMTNAATQKVASYWKGMVKDDLVVNQTGWTPEWTKGLTDGTTLGYISAAWGAGGLKTTVPKESGKWSAAPIPNWGTAASGSVGGSSFAISKDSKKADAAAEFITWATTTTAGVKARMSLGTSSALPADPKLRDTAKASFDTAFFGGQDLYSLAGAQVDTIQAGWIWSPVHNTTSQTLVTELGKAKTTGDFYAAFEAGQKAAEKQVTERGLTLAK
jgi:multiple sugar transport system substrate-binding protein